MNDRSRFTRMAERATFFVNRAFRYKRALWFAWSLLTWEQRMAFRGRFPELARELPQANTAQSLLNVAGPDGQAWRCHWIETRKCSGQPECARLGCARRRDPEDWSPAELRFFTG